MAERDDTLTLKTCVCCHEIKSPSDFYRNASTKDGLHGRCKKCHGISTSAYAERNRERSARTAAAWRARNPDKARALSQASKAKAYSENPEKFRQLSRSNRVNHPERTRASDKKARAKRLAITKDYFADYYLQNKDLIKARVRAREVAMREELRPYNAQRMRRRAARQLGATPAWANQAAIQAFYDASARATAETGVQHHVDHQVPLQSRVVCGLHVEHNLQVLVGGANQSKGNRHWPDMWE